MWNLVPGSQILIYSDIILFQSVVQEGMKISIFFSQNGFRHQGVDR